MEFYWTIKSIPELSKLHDEERKAIWRSCWVKASRNWKTRVEVLLIWGVVFFCAGFSARTWGLWGGITGGIIVGAVMGIVYVQFLIRKTTHYIREALNSHVKMSNSHEEQ
jgi:hypothetical protein